MSFRLSAPCPATAIPSGQTLDLPAGTDVHVTQTLGGSVTVRTDEGLFRIEEAHVGLLPGYVAPVAAAVASPSAFSEEAVWGALKTCFDPEIPVNIVDLGLVYDLSIETLASGARSVEVKMTLTAPGCGMGPTIAEDARRKIAALPSVESAKVHIVWDPVWTPQMISGEGRKILGLD